jgi:hypothetical protein
MSPNWPLLEARAKLLVSIRDAATVKHPKVICDIGYHLMRSIMLTAREYS